MNSVSSSDGKRERQLRNENRSKTEFKAMRDGTGTRMRGVTMRFEIMTEVLKANV
jgi:hypothetical protein